MKALVTGCAGFIGSHLCQRLIHEGIEIDGMDAFTEFYADDDKMANMRCISPYPHVWELDLADNLHINAALDGVTHVFHLAGQPGVRKSWGSDFDAYVRHNITATHCLLEACVGKSLQAFVVASSSSVYGTCHTAVTEDSPVRPFSPYGVTKLAQERLCLAYQQNHGVPVVALRYFTVFGPRQRPDMMIRRFIEAALDGQPVTIYGTGNQVRDFTYVDDVVRATVAAGTVLSAVGQVYNIAGGTTRSVNQIVDLLEQILSTHIERRYEPMPYGDVQETQAITEKAWRHLGWSPEVSFEAGLKEQVRWCKARRQRQEEHVA